MKLGTALVLICVTTSALACSGPGAQSSILLNQALGWIGLGAQAIASVFMFGWYKKVRKGPGSLWVIIPMLVLHPAWYVPTVSGDCGGGLVMMAFFTFCLQGALFFWQLSLVTGLKK